MKCRLGVLSKGLALGVMLALAANSSAWANSMTYGFDCISDNNIADCTTGESQLTVTVLDDTMSSDVNAGQVGFLFENSGPNASSITDVYFEDGTLLGIASIVDDGIDVAFSQNASPGDLPSGNDASPPFSATAGFTADSDPPAQPKGVNPGEELLIVFDLIGGQTWQDTIDALATDPNLEGSLRIGIHVQGFDGGGSESFVNGPPVPEPTTMLLSSLGLAGVFGYSWRRQRQVKA